MSNFQTHNLKLKDITTLHLGEIEQDMVVDSWCSLKSDIIVTRLAEHEPQEIECICTKITIAEMHWIIFSIYRPPSSGSSLDSFLTVLHEAVDKAITKFKNIVIVGDMNINTLGYSSSLNKLSEFCNTLDLHDLIKVSTCEM